MTTFLSNRAIYKPVICDLVPQVRERLLGLETQP